jgi:hypothetical protein
MNIKQMHSELRPFLPSSRFNLFVANSSAFVVRNHGASLCQRCAQWPPVAITTPTVEFILPSV